MLSYASIKESLINENLSERRLVDLVQQLSSNFTDQRDKIGDYWTNPDLVSAYALFYFPTNYQKLSWALGKINTDFINEELEIVDLGCGPGTFLHAFKDTFPELQKFVGIEHSRPMRDQAKKLWEKANPAEPCAFIEKVHELKTKTSKRLLVLGHALNEMSIEAFEGYLKKIDPDYLLFIEPGTKATFEVMKELRSNMLQRNFHIHYPCLSQNACPMVGTDDWCHQYIVGSFEPEIERLCQLVKLDRKYMPVIMHFYSKEAKADSQNSNEARIVRTYPESKFSVEWEVCRNHVATKIEHFQILKRNLTKNQIKALKDLFSGDSLEFEIEKELGERTLRLKKVFA